MESQVEVTESHRDGDGTGRGRDGAAMLKGWSRVKNAKSTVVRDGY